MPELNARVDAALAEDGPLASAWPGWRIQPAQRRMALAVADTLEQGGALLAQLQTGGGKTLAYLVPLLLSGTRAVVATSTHVLQHQLAASELPRLAQALGRPVQVGVLKGRGRYVCLQRLREAVQRGPRPGELPRHARMRELLVWAQSSRDGDVDEQPRLTSDPTMRAAITSTSESCLRQACPSLADCHVERARRRAGDADVVVINHHVWLSELRAQRHGRTAGVPRSDTLVFDEAHALHELARQWHTARTDFAAIARFWADLGELAQGPMRGAAPWAGLALQGGRALRALSMSLHGAAPREGLQAWPLADALVARELGIALQWAHRALSAAEGGDARLGALRERAVAIAEVLQGVLSAAGDQPTWLEWRGNQRWAMVRPGPHASEAAARELATGVDWGARSVVHTSATLGDEPGLRWHGDALGLVPSAVAWRVLPSEPDTPVGGAAWHVPPDLPDPADPAHGEALARCVAHWAERVGGQVLVLTTTRRAADRIAAALLTALPPRWRVQHATGESGRQGWLALRDETPTVVVASGAFWRGVDVPGNRLRLVVVDKLPFVPPDDPWLQQRLDRARASGLDAFDAVQVTDVAMALRQAAGRLIRGPDDRGLFVVGDVRLRQRAYAPRLLAAMANWRWLEDDASVQAWLDEMALTRASTTGRPCV